MGEQAGFDCVIGESCCETTDSLTAYAGIREHVMLASVRTRVNIISQTDGIVMSRNYQRFDNTYEITKQRDRSLREGKKVRRSYLPRSSLLSFMA